jgi:carboxylesterase type B
MKIILDLKRLSSLLLIVLIAALVNQLIPTTVEAVSLSKCSRNDNKEVALDTTSGRLLGSCEFVEVNDNNPRASKSGNVYSWLAVPYAEPPINQYRFKAPIEVRQRPEPIEAKNWPNSCVQLERKNSEAADGLKSTLFSGYEMWRVTSESVPISEDCLYLNIWLPAEAYLKINLHSQSHNLEPIKPAIMVFFHGGGSVRGSTSLDVYNPAAFVAATNTIVVTVNYRLGIFGNLYLENEFPGNQALMDQNEALRWVRNNADVLGGDPNRVTIAGFSTGAAQVGYHLLFKQSWQLFNNAILQSGTPLMRSFEAISREEASRRAREVFNMIGCLGNDTSDAEMAQCAQNSPYIDRASVDFVRRITNGDLFTSFNLMTPYPPVIDDRVLTDRPFELFERGDFKKCPILTGYLIDEGSMFAGYASKDLSEESIKQRPAVSHKDLKAILKSYLAYYPRYPHVSSDLLVDSVLHEYTKITESNTHIKSALLKPNYFHVLSKIIGDQVFICPAYRFVDLLAKHSVDVYLYLFAHRVSSTPWPSWYGATHGDELAFTFAHTLANRDESSVNGVNPWANSRHRYSSGEKLLTTEMITYWSNFIRNDSPNSKNINHWPKYTLFQDDFDSPNMTDINESVRYIIFKSTGIRVNRGYSLEVCQFWNSYVDQLLTENGNCLLFILLNRDFDVQP